MTPRDILLDNIPDLLAAFADDCTVTQAYEKLAEMNSPLAGIHFNSFKTTAPLVLATVKQVNKATAEKEQELAHITEAYNHTLEVLDATLSGYQEAISMLHRSSVQIGIQKGIQSSVQEDIQNSVCSTQETLDNTKLQINLSGIQSGIQADIQNSVQEGIQHTPYVTKSQVVSLIQSEVRKAFKQAVISIQTMPITGIQQPPNEYMPQVISQPYDLIGGIDVPAVYNGWSVNRGADGYLRINRKLKGVNRTLHIGRVWSAEKAQAKIDGFMETAGI